MTKTRKETPTPSAAAPRMMLMWTNVERYAFLRLGARSIDGCCWSHLKPSPRAASGNALSVGARLKRLSLHCSYKLQDDTVSLRLPCSACAADSAADSATREVTLS